MPISGDFQKLADLSSRFSALSTGEFYGRLTQRLGSRALELVSISFARGKDPDNRPWKPLATRSGSPLVQSGRLANSIILRAEPLGFSLESSVRYGAAQQRGAVVRARTGGWLTFQSGGRWYRLAKVVIPARPFLPEGRLPNRWRRAFETVVRNEVARLLKREGVEEQSAG